MVARQRLDLPGAITGIARRLNSAESSADLGFSSITRGGMRVESAEGIRVNTVPGGLPGLRVTGLELVDGTLSVTGVLEGIGDFVWSGPWALVGEGDITGNVDLAGILSVIAGGLIKVGTAMELSPAENGGSIKFNTGARIESYGEGNGLRLISSAGWQFYTGAGGYALNNPGISNGASVTGIGTQLLLGAASISIAASNLTLTGLVAAPSGTATVPLRVTAAGRVYTG